MGDDDEFERMMTAADLDIDTSAPPDVTGLTSVQLLTRLSEVREELRLTYQISPTTPEGFALNTERIALRDELARRKVR